MPLPNPEVVARRVGNSAVLVHLRTNRIYELNATGARVWELLADAPDLATVHARLASEFDMDPGQMASEVDELLARFEAEDLIQPRP